MTRIRQSASVEASHLDHTDWKVLDNSIAANTTLISGPQLTIQTG